MYLLSYLECAVIVLYYIGIFNNVLRMYFGDLFCARILDIFIASYRVFFFFLFVVYFCQNHFLFWLFLVSFFFCIFVSRLLNSLFPGDFQCD